MKERKPYQPSAMDLLAWQGLGKRALIDRMVARVDNEFQWNVSHLVSSVSFERQTEAVVRVECERLQLTVNRIIVREIVSRLKARAGRRGPPGERQRFR